MSRATYLGASRPPYPLVNLRSLEVSAPVAVAIGPELAVAQRMYFFRSINILGRFGSGIGRGALTLNLPVIVIDDDDGARDAILSALSEKEIPTHGYKSGPDFLAADPCPKGCILVDVCMPGMSGIELLQHVRNGGDITPVIVITGRGDIRMAVEAMKSGASDFLEKPFSVKTLVDAVNAVQHFQTIGGPSEELREKLTPRELDVFQIIAAGHSNKAAAIQLGISPRTVELHRANILRKLGAKNLVELIQTHFSAGPRVNLALPAVRFRGAA